MSATSILQYPGLPNRHVFTSAEYSRLAELNVFGDRRVELIGGEIVDMPPLGNWHMIGVDKALEVMKAAFGPNYWVRCQTTLDLSPHSNPEPDVAVVAGGRDSVHRGRNNPRTAVLVIEVSESSLRDDQNIKTSLYAAAGIADYWIVNLVDNRLEVYRKPVPDPNEPFAARYDEPALYLPGERVAPLALPGVEVAVDDLLP